MWEARPAAGSMQKPWKHPTHTWSLDGVTIWQPVGLGLPPMEMTPLGSVGQALSPPVPDTLGSCWPLFQGLGWSTPGSPELGVRVLTLLQAVHPSKRKPQFLHL